METSDINACAPGRRRWLASLGGSVVLAALGPGLARAQDKVPLKVLVGFPAGGGTDLIARYIAELLREALGRPVVVETRAGAGGRLAVDALVNSAPDGNTIMVAPNATPTFQTLVFGDQIRWALFKDLIPVAGVTSYPLGMAVTNSIGVSNVKEFVAWAKANPKLASFGTPGLGGQNHFMGVQFGKLANIDLRVIPYRGSPPMMVDLLGGNVPSGISLMDDMVKHHREGKLRIIGVFADKRSPLMPEVPTFAEQGYATPSGEAWTAIWAPAKTPAADLEKIQSALQKALAQPAVREQLASKINMEARYRDAKEMERVQREELAMWAPIIKASGFTPDQQ
jgi:tripartite-type tricarboxylate transporter receptor subunit TctC